MSEKEDYFSYLENVLGIKTVLIDQASQQASSQQIKSPLIFLVEGLSSYSADETELLNKMIAALKIDLSQVQAVDSQISASCEAEFTVHFVDHLGASLPRIPTGETVLVTHSPRFLLKNAAFKKQAWDDLQKVIRFFSRQAN
ncbi:hypothetical protein [Pseudobdellovibrio exovorus]|uniref:Uncharacterized protein n=1 Tax=Pseudobdellovibrio exovorus JSS TaxID=1184267 RepID=M4V9W7_9BACT|nr:hypothetical protein [Pseudobdellovibrio exovorus]AGH95255.1 hypothetical protein A11Q_1039 [Pseudobdellovibrio exovorus JSS]